MNWSEILPLLASVIVLGGSIIAFRSRQGKASGRASANTYQHLFERSHDGAIVMDVANGRIHLANPRAAEMLGYALDDLLSLTVFDLHFKEDLDRSSLRIADAWAKGGDLFDDIPFKRSDGEPLPVECSVKVTNHEGDPAIVMYMRDISERLRLQQEVAERNARVEEQNREMMSSLRYAQGIQQAMLPALSQLRGAFGDACILFKPRDIVSGDFYWCAQVGQKSILAVADCTGHGVPGALLTMSGIGMLQQIVNVRGVLHPAGILSELRTELLRSLAHQDDGAQVCDGMDMGIIVHDRVTRECEYSGALCPLYIVRKGRDAVEELKGDRFPIGFHDGELRPFTAHLFELNPGDRLFLASDGFSDQFGGPHGRKLKPSGLRTLLAELGDLNMCAQGRALERSFEQHRGSLEQVDDVTLVGVMIGG